YDKILDAHLIMNVEKHRKSAELTLSVSGQNLVAHSVTDDLFASIDETTDKMERQLKRYNSRINEHPHLSEEEKIEIAEKLAEGIASDEKSR
ncbi:ribosome-associated translation inhibitor RaiA, partial [bacterium]